jgi:hypothetical protein
LLDAIQFNDAGLQAAIASIKTDQAANGMQNDFEANATHLLLYNPVQKKRVDHAGCKCSSADISITTGEGANISSFGTKKGTGSSGVPLPYHTKAEYDLLERGQKDELRECRKSAEFKTANGKGKDGPRKTQDRGRFDTTKAIASAVENKVTEKMKATEQDKTSGDETEAYIMSIVKRCAAAKAGKVQISDATVEPTPIPTAPMLKNIIKQANNTKTGT